MVVSTSPTAPNAEPVSRASPICPPRWLYFKYSNNMKKNFDWLAPARWDHKNMNFVEAMLGDYFDDEKWNKMWNEVEKATEAFKEENGRGPILTEAAEIILSVVEKQIGVMANRRDQLLVIIGMELGMQHQNINGMKIAAMQAVTREKDGSAC